MLRRDIFNILMGKTVPPPVSEETAAVIGVPSYLQLEIADLLVTERHEVIANTDFLLSVSTERAFTITWVSAFATNKATSLCFGWSDESEAAEAIEVGLHADACLFIGSQLDNRYLNFDQLAQGIQFKLDVHPQPEGLTHARLIVMDYAGLTLATLKASVYKTTAWAGNVRVLGSDVSYIKIEGSKLKEA